MSWPCCVNNLAAVEDPEKTLPSLFDRSSPRAASFVYISCWLGELTLLESHGTKQIPKYSLGRGLGVQQQLHGLLVVAALSHVPLGVPGSAHPQQWLCHQVTQTRDRPQFFFNCNKESLHPISRKSLEIPIPTRAPRGKVQPPYKGATAALPFSFWFSPKGSSSLSFTEIFFLRACDKLEEDAFLSVVSLCRKFPPEKK